MKGVCLTGNRPQKLPFFENSREGEELKEKMRQAVIALIDEGYTHFISGMAQGCDVWFAECVINLKDVYPDVTLESAIPYPGQRDSLAVGDRFRYDRILRHSDEVNYISPTYSRYCMSKRNKYMVDNSDVILSVSYAETGGTVNTLTYARKKNKRIIDLTE